MCDASDSASGPRKIRAQNMTEQRQALQSGSGRGRRELWANGLRVRRRGCSGAESESAISKEQGRAGHGEGARRAREGAMGTWVGRGADVTVEDHRACHAILVATNDALLQLPWSRPS